jgi:peptide subunit release factor RF-3
VTADDPKVLAQFEKNNQSSLSLDAGENLTCLAPSEWMMTYIIERNPGVTFLKTREQV